VDIDERGGRQILMRTDDVASVGLTSWEPVLVDKYVDMAIGTVLESLSALVPDGFALLVQVLLSQRFEEHTLKPIGRHGFIEFRDIMSDAATVDPVRPVTVEGSVNVLAEHIFEQPGKVGTAQAFVLGTEVVAHVQTNPRGFAVHVLDHLEAAGQLVMLKDDLWNLRGFSGL
jgi:hypothetical protein